MNTRATALFGLVALMCGSFMAVTPQAMPAEYQEALTALNRQRHYAANVLKEHFHPDLHRVVAGPEDAVRATIWP